MTEKQSLAELDSALTKLGKHILFSRQETLMAARASVSDIHHEMDVAIEEIEAMKKDVQEKSSRLRWFDLVGSALGAGANKSQAIQSFISLVETEFREFSDHESALNDIVAYHGLREVLGEMQLYAICPALHQRTIGAIGGGFSSGKSAFVNSLFSSEAAVKLAEGIRPVTAIPSYVINGAKTAIQGISQKGGAFDIALDVYSDISHELLKAHPYLRDIIPYIIVSAPMTLESLDNLVFIDTPGYNPAANGTAEGDSETAKEYIKDASFLIWMVGLDSNGTIPQSDLEFLSRLEFGQSEDRKLYVIANKAELKTASDLEEILDTFSECLDDFGMQYAGITAYSSRMKKVFASRGMEIFDFLSANNVKREHHGHLIGSLSAILRPYVEEIYRDDNDRTQYRKAISSLLVEALRVGSIDAEAPDSRLEEGLMNLEGKFTHVEKLATRLERVEWLFDKFVRCIDEFCDEVGMEKSDISKLRNALFSKPMLKEAEPIMSLDDKDTEVGDKETSNVKAHGKRQNREEAVLSPDEADGVLLDGPFKFLDGLLAELNKRRN